MVSFYVAKGHESIGRVDRWVWVWAPNSVWILVPLLGLFVSVRLILDGTYGVLGH